MEFLGRNSDYGLVGGGNSAARWIGSFGSQQTGTA